MRKEGQDRHDLVLVTEGCNKRTHGSTSSEIVQKFEFVLNAMRAACHVDFLERNITGFSSFDR